MQVDVTFYSNIKIRDKITCHNIQFVIKLKLSLCLTKRHALKTHPVFNYAPRHDGVWGSGGTAPRINLGIRLK
jgi:hypothetical protein